jgi:Rieske Fe-S protein
MKLPSRPPSDEVISIATFRSRRAFCTSACRAATMVAAGHWLSGCDGPPTAPGGELAVSLPTVAAAVSGRTVTVPNAQGSPLAAVGDRAIAQTSIGEFLIVRSASDAFTVLTATCTHQGCTITGHANGRFVCPCHGSQFTTTGEVAGGPASRPLGAFASRLRDGVLTFTV